MIQIKLTKNWRDEIRGKVIDVNEVVANALVKQDFGLLVLPEKQVKVELLKSWKNRSGNCRYPEGEIVKVSEAIANDLIKNNIAKPTGQDRPVEPKEAPIEPIKVEKVQKIPKYLSIEEVRKLINQPYLEGIKYKEGLKNKRRNKGQVWLKRIKNNLFRAKRDYAILSLFYSSGIRLAELVGLNMQDIDFDRGIMKVLGKGSREREATLTVEAIKVLQAYLKARKNWKGCKGESIFLSREGNRITKMCVQRFTEQYGIEAGIDKKVTPHMLRHSSATHFVNGGMDLIKVQNFLGHRSLISTQIYTHLQTDDQKEERNKLHPLNKFGLKAI